MAPACANCADGDVERSRQLLVLPLTQQIWPLFGIFIIHFWFGERLDDCFTQTAISGVFVIHTVTAGLRVFLTRRAWSASYSRAPARPEPYTRSACPISQDPWVDGAFLNEVNFWFLVCLFFSPHQTRCHVRTGFEKNVRVVASFPDTSWSRKRSRSNTWRAVVTFSLPGVHGELRAKLRKSDYVYRGSLPCYARHGVLCHSELSTVSHIVIVAHSSQNCRCTVETF